jgi:hypothetical protein
MRTWRQGENSPELLSLFQYYSERYRGTEPWDCFEGDVIATTLSYKFNFQLVRDNFADHNGVTGVYIETQMVPRTVFKVFCY